MRDIRLQKLAELLIDHSVSLKEGEHLLIRCTDKEVPLAQEIIEACWRKKAYPHVQISNPLLTSSMLTSMNEACAAIESTVEQTLYSNIDACINITTTNNPYETSEIPNDCREIWNRNMQKAHERMRNGDINWCVAIYPTSYYANSAGMPLEKFEDYYFKVCLMDYRRFGAEMKKLKDWMDKTDKIHIVSPNTDISFSVKGVNKCVSSGERNVPDGEVYTAPVKESVEGKILFNVPTIFNGKRFEYVQLIFEKGKVTEFHTSDDISFEKIINIDLGARYVGEFAFGLNPFLTEPIGTVLFDEKVRCSFHFALGNALDLTDNGNRSLIHWDLVCLQTKEKGGGCIYTDGKLLRKDGMFIPEELKALNKQDY